MLTIIKNSGIAGFIIKAVAVILICIGVYLAIDGLVSSNEMVEYAENMDSEVSMVKADFAKAYKLKYIEPKVTDKKAKKSNQLNSKTEIIESTGGGKPVTTLENRFVLYDGPTVASSKAKVIDVLDFLKKDGISPHSWAAYEGFPWTSQPWPNKYAFIDNGGKINKSDCDFSTQMWKGRHFVAVGPYVWTNRSYRQGDSEDNSHYGTQIDVVVTDKNGKEYWLPCIIMDMKAHTWSNGLYQTGISMDRNGKKDDQSAAHADHSVIEFCTKKIATIAFKSYTINKIVVY